MSLVDEQVRRAHAARLGVMIFLASEGLLFAGLFALYAAYRVHYPAAFALGVRSDLRWLGSLNTGILLASSGCMAGAVSALAADAPDRQHRRRLARMLMFATVTLGIAFLALKGCEYAEHIHDGMVPGGHRAWFDQHAARGISTFVALYYLMTGLHALHMIVGISWVLLLIPLASAGRAAAHRVELGALYWHFVDLLWVFLWPLFYLMRI